MTADNTELGRCPYCDQSVPTAELLIDYKSKHGTHIVVANCRECVAAVTVV